MQRLLLMVTLLLSGCGSCAKKPESDEYPSTPSVALTRDVHITVERPGKPPFVIDEKVLASTSKNIVEGPLTAWSLVRLVPEWDEKAPVDVIDEEGFRSPLLRRGEDPLFTETLLIVGADGETRVIRISKGKPITAHRGEARKDAGRVRHATKLVFLEADAGVAGPAVSLGVVVHGQPTTWTREELAKLGPIILQSKDGDGERDAWPLRELAKRVSNDAMPTELVGEEPASLRIDAAKWKDPRLVPVIRANRRGRLKLVWLDATTKEEDHDEPQMKGVREVRFP